MISKRFRDGRKKNDGLTALDDKKIDLSEFDAITKGEWRIIRNTNAVGGIDIGAVDPEIPKCWVQAGSAIYCTVWRPSYAIRT